MIYSAVLASAKFKSKSYSVSERAFAIGLFDSSGNFARTSVDCAREGSNVGTLRPDESDEYSDTLGWTWEGFSSNGSIFDTEF